MEFFGHFRQHYRRRKRHGYFMQDGATVHTANCSIIVFNKVFEDNDRSQIVACRYPALIPCDFICGETLKRSVFQSPHIS
jgi:hypothetical protein